MTKWVKSILVVLGTGCLFALGSMNVFDRGVDDVKRAGLVSRQGAEMWNKRVIDSTVAILQSGNVVLRMGLGADSRLLSLINRKDKSYSHCGIVMIENGYPFVYHCIGGEDNPDERLRRDSAFFFFSPRHNSNIAVLRYDYSAQQINELKSVVSAFYRARPKFDLQFDLSTDDKLYCSEFAYKAITRATHDTGYIHTTHVPGRDFVGVDDLFVNKHARFIRQIQFK